MNILFAASEAEPFYADNPGLSNIAGNLPEALARDFADVRVILPLYQVLSEEWRGKLVFIDKFIMKLGCQSRYCGLYELVWHDVTWYFIENEYYFQRPALYGYDDDGERFAFFSKAALESLRHVDFLPGVLHCFGWQTALSPVYLDLFYKTQERFAQIKTIYTFIDIREQPKYEYEAAISVLGLGDGGARSLEHDGHINIVKGAIEASDIISTVSPGYANIIPYHACSSELGNPLLKKTPTIAGILNGIDAESYDPQNDPEIEANYCADDFDKGKAVCKKALRETFGLRDGPWPIVGIAVPLTRESGIELIIPAADMLLESGFQLAVAGSGDESSELFFTGLNIRRPGDAGVIICDHKEREREIFAGCDLFLSPAEWQHMGCGYLEALRYGALPIIREPRDKSDAVQDCSDGQGNGFTFSGYDPSSMFDACMRAYNMYFSGDGWHDVVRRAMRCDNSWEACALKYLELYSLDIGGGSASP